MSDKVSSAIEELLKNRPFIAMLDRMAQRYGRLPHELLRDTTLFEFSIDMAILIAATYEESDRERPAQDSGETIPGFDRTVKPKE